MSDRKRTLQQIEFLTGGNAVLRFTDGHETLVPSGDVSEELCQIQGREWGANLSSEPLQEGPNLSPIIAPWAPCKRPLGCDHPDCECGAQRPPDMPEQAVAALTSTCNYDLAAYVTDLARWVDALQTAITTHHATKHGSEPATARSVRSPVDRTLYEAAGTPHAVLAWDAGRDEGGVAATGTEDSQ